MNADDLHEAALAYLARRPATATMMKRVLQRRALKKGVPLDDVADDIQRVIARLVEVGLVDDASFAASRVDRLARGGRSSRAIAAHLAQRGVRSDVARAALATRDANADLDAALVLTRKRRIGAFARTPATDPDARRKELGILARAGFDRSIAERALRIDREEAEERLFATNR